MAAGAEPGRSAVSPFAPKPMAGGEERADGMKVPSHRLGEKETADDTEALVEKRAQTVRGRK